MSEMNKLPQAIGGAAVSAGSATVSYATQGADAVNTKIASDPNIAMALVNWIEVHASFVAAVMAVASAIFAIRASMATARYRKAQIQQMQSTTTTRKDKMKPNKRSLLIALALIIGLISMAIGGSALFAQTLPTEIPAKITPEDAQSFLQPIINALTMKYGWVVTVLLVIGIMRFLFKPLMSLLEAVVKITPTESDDRFLAKCQDSAWYRWLWWLIDWLGSIKPPKISTTNPALTKNGPAL